MNPLPTVADHESAIDLPPSIRWRKRFAARADEMRRSAVRELLKVAAHPETISFAGGLPAPELFPLDELESAFAEIRQQAGAAAFQYGETEGVGELRDWIARAHSRPGLTFTRDHVAVFSGAQQALDLLGRIFINPGDRVAVENPTYLALLTAWRACGAEFAAMPGDDEGLQVEALSTLLPRAAKLLYLTPNFQNPRGTTLSATRRGALVQLARERNLGVVEDDPYGALRYDGDEPASLLELDAPLDSTSGAGRGPAGGPGQVIFVGSFSKVLAPGLRVGWVTAAPDVIEKLVQAKQAADLHTSTLSQHLVLGLLRRGVLDRQIPKLREAYRRRRDALLAALARHFPAEVRWTRPSGGMFVWVTLPDGADARALLRAALTRQVAFVPGEEFHLHGQGRNTLRLNFTNASPDRISEGIRRLRAAWDEACPVPPGGWPPAG